MYNIRDCMRIRRRSKRQKRQKNGHETKQDQLYITVIIHSCQHFRSLYRQIVEATCQWSLRCGELRRHYYSSINMNGL